MANIRQTKLYAEYMTQIGWIVDETQGAYIYTKRFPLIGSAIKIQRPARIPDSEPLKTLVRKYRSFSLVIEPQPGIVPDDQYFKLVNDRFIHTKTIHIELTSSETEIFNRFSNAKRRAVKKAQKLGVRVSICHDFDAFIHLKNKTSDLFLGFLTTRMFRPLWNIFAPKHACVLLATLSQENAKESKQPIAGILMFYIDKTAYYWMAAATKEGKSYFAPTLLVWEALKYAKHQECEIFDFEGVYDERFGSYNKDWQGFSKFKEGFGGKEVYYPAPVTLRK
ncbi:peptidoglycan bridge formation glycyltransferase FemA/FemB family protein [Candidatus Gottesmanbacteria bacterium]|nr:peptidoglycan bridge formation glycyltransferase FemA/FemB family protein [Candidatus Gottesmanbacteria bacterium]